MRVRWADQEQPLSPDEEFIVQHCLHGGTCGEQRVAADRTQVVITGLGKQQNAHTQARTFFNEFLSLEPDSRYNLIVDNQYYEYYQQEFWTRPLQDDSHPLPPTNVRVSAASPTSLQVSWTPQSAREHQVECTLVEMRNGNRFVVKSAVVRRHV